MNKHTTMMILLAAMSSGCGQLGLVYGVCINEAKSPPACETNTSQRICLEVNKGKWVAYPGTTMFTSSHTEQKGHGKAVCEEEGFTCLDKYPDACHKR